MANENLDNLDVNNQQEQKVTLELNIQEKWSIDGFDAVIGNPPYSGISSNNSEWISKLIEDYKYVDGVHFNERKHWLNDDYVKFLRYGQHFIEKNGSGVLAFINPHGFLFNPTFFKNANSVLRGCTPSPFFDKRIELFFKPITICHITLMIHSVVSNNIEMRASISEVSKQIKIGS